MTTLHFNGAAGTLTVGLAPGDTTMSSAGLADLGVVTAPDVAAVTLYSVSSSGRPTIEIVHVTAHTALATTATILRAREGTTARTWGSFATWLHGITVQDYTDLAGLVTTEAAARLAADVAHAAALDPHPGYLTPAEGNATYVGKAGDTMTGQLVIDTENPNAAALTILAATGQDAADVAVLDIYNEVGVRKLRLRASGKATVQELNALNSAYIAALDPAQPALRTRGAPAHTGDLQQWQTDAGVSIAKTTAAGEFVVRGPYADVRAWGHLVVSNNWTAAIHAARDFLVPTGGVLMLPESYPHDALDFSGITTALKLKGLTHAKSSLKPISATADTYNLTGSANIEFEDLTIVPNGQVVTAGRLFVAVNCTGLAFRRLRVGGFFRGFDLDNTDNVMVDDVIGQDYTTSQWDYFLYSHGGGAALTIKDSILRSAVTSGATKWAFILEDCDTVKMYGCGAQKFGAGSAFFSGLKITRGQWIEVMASHFECGKNGGIGVVVEDGSYGVDFLGCHATTGIIGLVTRVGPGSIGPQQVSWRGGRIAFNGQHGVLLEAGTGIHIDTEISNNSITTPDTYDGVHVNAGVSDWKINGRIGTYMIPVAGGGTRHRYGVRVDAGASNRYKIGATITDAATASISDLGTGQDKDVEDPYKVGQSAGFYGALAGFTTTANQAIFTKIYVPRRMAVNRIVINVITQSGNIDVGIFTFDGTTFTPIVTKGSTACPAAPRAELSITETMLGPGYYWLGYVPDNVTTSVAANTEAGNLAGAYRLVASFPLPVIPFVPTGRVEQAIGIGVERV